MRMLRGLISWISPLKSLGETEHKGYVSKFGDNRQSAPPAGLHNVLDKPSQGACLSAHTKSSKRELQALFWHSWILFSGAGMDLALERERGVGDSKFESRSDDRGY